MKKYLWLSCGADNLALCWEKCGGNVVKDEVEEVKAFYVHDIFT